MTRRDVPDLAEWQARRIVAWGRLLLAAIVLAMIGVLGRVVQLKVEPDPRLAAAAGTSHSTRSELARRGDLLDRRGRLIAASAVGYRLFVDATVVDDLLTIAVDIADLIGGDPVDVDRLISERPESRYIVVKGRLADWQIDAIRQARLRGVGLEPHLVRHYPNGTVAAGLVGMVGFEHRGLSGLEHRYDDRLAPHAGRMTFLRDARSRPIWVDPDGYEPSRDGASVRLSIDLVIQRAAERRLRQAVLDVNAGGGRLVVMDVRLGEILAMCDVLNPRPGWEEVTSDPARVTQPALARNRCLTDPYEPGSTFKPFVWAAATELGLAQLDEMLPIPEGRHYYTPYGRRIRDAHDFGPSTWLTTLEKSINSGMAIVAERMTHRQMQETIHRFGFGQRTGCGLPGESRGIVTTPKDWTAYSQSSVAMGHEICVTPLQMVRAFSAIARDGTIPAIRFTTAGDGDMSAFARRAMPASMVGTVRDALGLVMTSGTGRRAQSDLYTLFGKSGTAQLPKIEGGGYHEDRYVSSFIAGAPASAPRLVVLCVIDDPDRSKAHYGGAVAGPVVRDIVDEVLPYLGVAPDKPSPALAQN